MLSFIIDISLVFHRTDQERWEQLKPVREGHECTRAACAITSQFLSAIGQALRSPLTSIKASRDLLNTGVLGEGPGTLKPALSIAAGLSHEGGTAQVRGEQRGERMRFRGQGDGIGIAENAHDRVYGTVGRVVSSDIRKAGGTGLGINIARQTVEGHDGRVNDESERGRGATVPVEVDRIPKAAKVEAAAGDQPMAVSAQAQMAPCADESRGFGGIAGENG